jgi:type IV pilus assembly protein PilV
MSRIHQRGFTLLEVLIALVIFSLGLLGMAGLLTVSVKTNHSAYLRSQAFLLAQDMADRMRANGPGMWKNKYTLNTIATSGTPTAVAFTALTPTTSCQSSCDETQLATRDLLVWQNQLVEFLPNVGAAIACAAPGTTGNPKAPYPQTCEIQISWTQLAIAGPAQPDIFDWVFQP